MIFASESLTGKHIVVTGASSGLGQAAANYMAALGANLSLIGRDQARLDETETMLAGSGSHATYAADVGDFTQADALVQKLVLERGAVDGLFHSAGTSLVMPMRLTKKSQVDDLFGAAVMGALGMAKALSRKNAMNDGGSLVFMSSVSAVRGRRGMVAYSAAKAATSGLVRALAIELAERKIRVNSITAGAVETAMHRNFVESVSEELVDGYRSLHPLGFGQPEDVGGAVAFLLSDASRWITGIDLPVDGGYAAK
ncbi:SDR family NAD(P)-dependent oxidoreductase [Sphingobium boeckii]|uniref:NAD(P)-dependent dehydrogenase (Short-subunit alcohol dehydrogenase family) n=1 Tax=Sphingobium boeckii TaxID=1082345 RepID=A0A7W9AHR4_9SPHN|nr:SDR family oxidoreductase [Sphingobium boeckii]MBB5685737.1 NAD(P)-dependent dehydrogenase (short-subunit alcohol dehydrogenase family) [Sphingobium boeckii]